MARGPQRVAGRRPGNCRGTGSVGGGVLRVGLVHRLAVQDQLLVHEADVVAGNPDGALHVIFLDVQRIAEHDDVAAAHVAVRQQHGARAVLRSVNQLVHQHVVANQQRALHRSAGNHERLDQRGGREKQQDDGHRPLGDEPAVHVLRHGAGNRRHRLVPGFCSFCFVSTLVIVSDKTREHRIGRQILKRRVQGGLDAETRRRGEIRR